MDLNKSFQEINPVFESLESRKLIAGKRYSGSGNLNNIVVTPAGYDALRSLPPPHRKFLERSMPYLKWIGAAAGALTTVLGLIFLL